MPRFFVAIYRPNDYDPSQEDAAMGAAIDALNDEMIAAGVRFFAGGLKDISEAKSLEIRPGWNVFQVDGPYLATGQHLGGFWILEVADMDEALAWGRKAAVACRAPVEVRAFH